MLLQFFNLVLHWISVTAAWKISTVVPVFKHGDSASPDQYRTISLASCAFKKKRLIHTRIAPHISERLNEGQGGFRWGADTMVYSLVDALRLRRETHTFCAFVDIRKAFDTCWVEATLVRLFQVGVAGGMWRTIANFLCGTLSQVRTGSDVSHPWVDSGVAQGRVLSPLLFNLLVNSLAATISRASLGVRLSSCSDFRLSNQLYADDLVILQESAADLQAALDAVSHWGQQWRFSFGIGPEKSAVVIFGPSPVMLSLAKCTSKATFCLSSLPIATSEWSSLPHFPGAIMSIIWWTAGADCLRSVCLGFDQRACQSLSRLFLLSTYVLPSASFGIEFAGECPRSLARFDRALRQCGRHLLGWPSGTPNASVLCELGLHDGLRVSSDRALALYARLASFALGSRPPVPASVFTLAQSTTGSWAHWCRAVISHHSVQRPDLCGVGPGCSASVTQRWGRRSVTPVLDRSWIFHPLEFSLHAFVYLLGGKHLAIIFLVIDLWYIFLWHTESLTVNHHHDVTATCCFVWRFTFLCFSLCLWLYSCHGCNIDCPRRLVRCFAWSLHAAICPAWNHCAAVCPAWNRGTARRAGLLCLFAAPVVSRTSSSPAPYGVDTI